MLGTSADRSHPAVLVIDDDPVSREVVATLLTLSGYTLEAVASGEEALAVLAKGEFVPQLILTDVQMPGLSGANLIAALRKACPARMYAISGNKAPEAVRSAVDGFLEKPFTPAALERLLAHDPVTAPAPAPETQEVIDSKVLGQFRQLMPEAAVRQVYDAVLGDLKRRDGELAAAIAAGDADTVRRIGHSLKGGCGMAGIQQAARLGARLEVEGDDLNNSDAIRLDLKAVTESLERMLEVEFRG